MNHLFTIPEAERNQLLVAWNSTQADYPHVCVHELFEAQVLKLPDAIALVAGSHLVTYRELNQRANQLAHYLQALGVKADSLVGICVERDPLMIIGILGILKAGGAYVPLDPTYPKARLQFMLSNAEIDVLLTNEHLLSILPQTTHIPHVVCLDRDWENIISKGPDDHAVKTVHPHHLAYVIYTSGSTGEPKGVAMEHRSLTNLLWWHTQKRPSSCGLKALQFCAISFDFSVHEIFSTLCFGGTLVLVAEEVRRNPFALAKFIFENQIEKLFLPVTALQQLAEAVDSETVSTTLREVITTGEQLQITPAMVSWFRQTGAMLHNHYGATEFQDATTFTLSEDPTDWQALSPIGRPLSNVQIYILDELKQLVPVGEVGELYIGGAGVARGYLNRPELTTEKFIPNPFAAGCLYKTGDLARYQADGTIENLGRTDDQVKIHGIRIELGEIEAVLAKHPLVRESVVVSHEQRLAAYLVVRQQDPSNQLETLLYSYLSERLPDYMLPEAFVVLDEMPLTPSGKINRRALPEPKKFRQTLDSSVSMSQSETQQRLVEIWQAALQLEAVGIHDNFFDIGATSLLLIQIHQQLVETFGRQLSNLTLFQYPTIKALAQYLSPELQNRSVAEKPVKAERLEEQEVLEKLGSKTTMKQRQLRRTHRARKARREAVLPQIKPSTINIWPSAGEYPVYDAYLYHLMTTVDEHRNKSYKIAINNVVKDKTVVDIGTGQDAILSVFCVQGGARKVYAIERDLDSYHLAVARLKKLDMLDIVSVIHGEATQITLPEPVDVCVSEVIGNIGGSEGAAVILNEARRFLKPNGIMIPERCLTRIAAATVPQDVLRRPKLNELAAHYTNKVFESVGYPFDIRVCMGKFPKANLLSDSGIFEDLAFTQITNTMSSHGFSLTIKQDGRWDGFILWLNLYVIESEVVNTLEYDTNWAPVYFPIFEPGVEVSRGDIIQATCQRTLSDNQINPDYVVSGYLKKKNGQVLKFKHDSYYRKAQFRQHPFYQRLFASKRWSDA